MVASLLVDIRNVFAQQYPFTCPLRVVGGDKRAFALQYIEAKKTLKFICDGNEEHYVPVPCGDKNQLIFSVRPFVKRQQNINGWPMDFYFFALSVTSVTIRVVCPS
jgi:hypothetical protein